MTLLIFFGCLMIAFGPALSIFVIVVSKNPIRVIILISSAFFWLLSLIISSFIWFLIHFIENQLVLGIILSIFIQEAFRYLFYKVLKNAETSIKKFSGVSNGIVVSDNENILALVSGLGFGLMSGAFSILNILTDSLGPGTVGLLDDSRYFFLVSSLFTLAFTFLHVFWNIILFKSLNASNKYLFFYVILSHLTVSLISLLNQSWPYIVSLILTYLITSVTALIAFSCAGGSKVNFLAVLHN